MLTTNDRQVLIAFLNQHADGDVLIQAANRVANNLEDVQTLKNFIDKYKPSAPVPPPNVDRGNATSPAPMREINNPEDLGPVPSKLGANGRAIQKHMEKHRDTEFSVDGLVAALKIPIAKVKPMVALLIERDIIIRVSNSTYQIK